MAEFVVELYVSRMDGAGARRDPERARLAAEELTWQGTPVRYLRAILVPEDETCLLLYDATSADTVRASPRADLPFGPRRREEGQQR